jgi:hypothetical protein
MSLGEDFGVAQSIHLLPLALLKDGTRAYDAKAWGLSLFAAGAAVEGAAYTVTVNKPTADPTGWAVEMPPPKKKGTRKGEPQRMHPEALKTAVERTHFLTDLQIEEMERLRGDRDYIAHVSEKSTTNLFNFLRAPAGSAHWRFHGAVWPGAGIAFENLRSAADIMTLLIRKSITQRLDSGRPGIVPSVRLVGLRNADPHDAIR